MNIVYLNGKYLPLAEAKISVMDRGFLFADGVYEMLPAYQGKLFTWDLHYARLQRGLNAISLQLHLSDAELKAILQQLIQRNPSADKILYLQVTRGAESERNHYYSDNIKPSVFAYAAPMPVQSQTDIKPGHAITQDDVRWQRCDIKSINLLPNIMARQLAQQQGATEAILVRDDMVNEGASSNVFIVNDQQLITPPLSNKILPGVTRQVVLALAMKHNIPVQLRHFTVSELYTADEVWITSSGREIQPIIQVDNKLINDGKIGVMWCNMIQYFYDYKKEVASERE